MFKRVAASLVAVGAVALVWAGSATGATGSQRFTISGSDNGGHVYASGPISGSGHDVVLGQNADRFVFPAGSVLVSHHATSMNDNFDPRSCLDRFTESGTYSLSSGTGAYKGVSGSGSDIVLGQNADKFVFRAGSVLVSHHATSTHDNFDPRSCLDRFTESGTYSLSSGTGAYRGVTGSGSYTASGVARGTRTANGCSMNSKSRYLVKASGWTSLP